MAKLHWVKNTIYKPTSGYWITMPGTATINMVLTITVIRSSIPCHPKEDTEVRNFGRTLFLLLSFPCFPLLLPIFNFPDQLVFHPDEPNLAAKLPTVARCCR